MSLADKPLEGQKNLKQWARQRWILLLLISLGCFLLLTSFSWLDGVTTYGHRHLSFNSTSLDLLFDLTYKDKTVSFSLPQKNISRKISAWRFGAFGKKYWLYLKITTLNLLFLIFALLIRYIVKNRCDLIKRFKRFWGGPGSVKLLFVTKIILFVIFMFSIFPTPQFNVWWKRFAFVADPQKQSSITLALYEFMRLLLIDKGNSFFYASLFTLPYFIIKWAGISSLLLLIMGQIKLPAAWGALINRFLNKLSNQDYKKWLIGASLWVFILANIISLTKNQHLPAYIEDTAQFFQARIFAAGKLAESINFSREFFEFPLMRMDTQWYSNLAPGQSFLLALGHKAGIPWLINPLLGLLVVMALYLLANNIYGHATAMLSTVFMGFSPLYLSLSASFLNHLPFILFLLLAMLFYQHSRQKPKLRYPVFSGLCWGAALMIRPSSALVMVLPVIVYSIKKALSRDPDFGLKRKYLFFLVGLAFLLPLLLTYNQLLQGNPWGATSSYWLTKGLHNPSQGLFYLMNNLSTLNNQLWGWVLPGFCLILIWILSSRKLEQWDYMLLWITICLLAFNFSAYDIRPGLANPLLVSIPFWAVLTARAIMNLPKGLERFGFSAPDIKSLLALGVVVSCITLLCVRVIPLLYPGDSHHPGGTHRLNIAGLIKQEKVNNAIIFLKQEPFLQTFAYNQPDLKNDILFARHLKGYNNKLMNEFPSRSYYFYNESENKLISLSPQEKP